MAEYIVVSKSRKVILQIAHLRLEVDETKLDIRSSSLADEISICVTL